MAMRAVDYHEWHKITDNGRTLYRNTVDGKLLIADAVMKSNIEKGKYSREYLRGLYVTAPRYTLLRSLKKYSTPSVCVGLYVDIPGPSDRNLAIIAYNPRNDQIYGVIKYDPTADATHQFFGLYVYPYCRKNGYGSLLLRVKEEVFKNHYIVGKSNDYGVGQFFDKMHYGNLDTRQAILVSE